MDECNPKILLVDDNVDFYRLIIEEGKLQEIGDLADHVIFEMNALNAIETYKRENPCIVIMDIRMPGLSGIEAAKRIQQYNPDANIFLLTNYPEDPDAIQAVHDGIVFGIMPKHCGQGVVAVMMKFMLNYIERAESLGGSNEQ